MKMPFVDALKWGLIPYWAKHPKIAYKTNNARVETVDTAPSYRQGFKKRRCLIPAHGFYEWKKVLGVKIPYSISMKDNSPFVFAGLWDADLNLYFLRKLKIADSVVDNDLSKWTQIKAVLKENGFPLDRE